MVVNVNGSPSVRIDCKIVVDKAHLKAILVEYCEEQFWLPRSVLRDNKDGTIDVQEQWYEKNMNC